MITYFKYLFKYAGTALFCIWGGAYSVSLIGPLKEGPSKPGLDAVLVVFIVVLLILVCLTQIHNMYDTYCYRGGYNVNFTWIKAWVGVLECLVAMVVITHIITWLFPLVVFDLFYIFTLFTILLMFRIWVFFITDVASKR